LCADRVRPPDPDGPFGLTQVRRVSIESAGAVGEIPHFSRTGRRVSDGRASIGTTRPHEGGATMSQVDQADGMISRIKSHIDRRGIAIVAVTIEIVAFVVWRALLRRQAARSQA
jgi:hypothetical protein